MTRPKFVNSAFDPNQCPLLQGLSPEEQQIRMAEDPIIRQCIGHIGKSGVYPAQCSHLDPQPAPGARRRAAKAAVVA